MSEDRNTSDAETTLAEFAAKAIEAKQGEVYSFLKQPRVWGLIQGMSRDGVSLWVMAIGIKQATGRATLSHNTLAKVLRTLAVEQGDQEILGRFGWASSTTTGNVLLDAAEQAHLISKQVERPASGLPLHIQPGPPSLAGQALLCRVCNGPTESWLVETPDGLKLPVSVCCHELCGAATCKSSLIWMCPVCWGLSAPTQQNDGWQCLNAKCSGKRDNHGKPIPANTQRARPKLNR